MLEKSALIIVDVQNDFCPGGALPVRDGNKIVQPLNDYIELFRASGRPIYATRDWHPVKTVHFKEYGGEWPAHCVMNTMGARFHPELRLPVETIIVTKGEDPKEDSYSGFQGKAFDGVTMAESLREKGIDHIYVGGLATDYCVRATVVDGLKEGFKVTLLLDAIKGVDVIAGDSDRAIEEMISRGASTATLRDLRAGERYYPMKEAL